ncbi:MAG: mono/diheme cytochrome c family protein [Candidatus Azotimanducaceae bacterium]|jgi:mono/diheme cytochrome c family protein
MFSLTLQSTILLSLVCAAILNSGLCLGADAATKTSLSDGVYNKSQAKLGKKLYKKHCISCHEKGYFEPVLLTWQGQPAVTLFSLMSAAMPESEPGSLTTEEYTDIFAYVLKESGYPASTETLDTDSEEFANIIIMPPL